jgi:hypothetical protein
MQSTNSPLRTVGLEATIVASMGTDVALSPMQRLLFDVPETVTV